MLNEAMRKLATQVQIRPHSSVRVTAIQQGGLLVFPFVAKGRTVKESCLNFSPCACSFYSVTCVVLRFLSVPADNLGQVWSW